MKRRSSRQDSGLNFEARISYSLIGTLVLSIKTLLKMEPHSDCLPAVVDFYADWCKPCLEMSPVLDEIAREYQGKIVIYKVDIASERQLAEKMHVKRLPLLVFIPLNGSPKLVTKALPKELLVKTVEELLLVRKMK